MLLDLLITEHCTYLLSSLSPHLPSILTVLLSHSCVNYSKAHAGTQGFLIGDKLSLADVQLFSGLELVPADNLSEALAKYPKLKHIVDNVGAIPAVSKYRAERKVTFA